MNERIRESAAHPAQVGLEGLVGMHSSSPCFAQSSLEEVKADTRVSSQTPRLKGKRLFFPHVSLLKILVQVKV